MPIPLSQIKNTGIRDCLEQFFADPANCIGPKGIQVWTTTELERYIASRSVTGRITSIHRVLRDMQQAGIVEKIHLGREVGWYSAGTAEGNSKKQGEGKKRSGR